MIKDRCRADRQELTTIPVSYHRMETSTVPQKTHLRLQHSEGIVVHAASRIYAAYIAAGQVTNGNEDQWISRSIEEALQLAVQTDDRIESDDEVQSGRPHQPFGKS